jgi:GcrA cell cycle regulator
MSGTAWTPEQDARLQELWGMGLSAAAIGRAMGCTKNAIVGRSHRLKLPARPSPIRPATGRPPKKAHPYRGAAAVITARAAMRSSPVPPPATTRPPQVPTAIPLATGAGATISAAGMPPEAGPQGAGAVSCSPGNSPAAVASTNAAAAGFSGGCRWPLWGNERPTHRYCDAPRRDVACSYCTDHAAVAFQRVAPTGSLAAWSVTERKFHRTAGQGGLTAGSRFYA